MYFVNKSKHKLVQLEVQLSLVERLAAVKGEIEVPSLIFI